ncbi:MAG: hypothetical protein V4674_00450 [Patescibacteria group bacterium]
MHQGRKIQFATNEKQLDITCWLENASGPSLVAVSINGHAPQSLQVEWEQITYGERAYFRCDCGSRATKLYLPPNGHTFKCRNCHGLQYQLSSFNRHSVAGVALYRMNRLQKLANSRADIGRILYKGSYTKRFERFLGLCDRAGLDSIVRGANDLKTLIEGNDSNQSRIFSGSRR